MKVRFLKNYVGVDGFVFERGWTAELTDPDAERLIADGTCEAMPDDTRARRLAPEAPPVTECVETPPLESKQKPLLTARSK